MDPTEQRQATTQFTDRYRDQRAFWITGAVIAWSVLIVFIAFMTWSMLTDTSSAPQSNVAFSQLHLPARVPYRATLQDGRTVQGVAAPLDLLCLERATRQWHVPLSDVALYPDPRPPRPDVLAETRTTPIRELRLDPAINARLNAAPQTLNLTTLPCPGDDGQLTQHAAHLTLTPPR